MLMSFKIRYHVGVKPFSKIPYVREFSNINVFCHVKLKSLLTIQTCPVMFLRGPATMQFHSEAQRVEFYHPFL